MHQDLYRAPGGPRQGVLHPGGHRRALAAAGRGHRRGDEPQRGRRHPGAELHRRECLDQGRQAHSVIHRGGQQDGMEEILIMVNNKKILFVSTFEIYGNRWGRNFPLAKTLAANGFQVTMLVTEKNRKFKLYNHRKIDNVDIIAFNVLIPLELIKYHLSIFTYNFIARIIFAIFNKFDFVYSDCGECPCSGWPCRINQLIYKSIYISEYGDLLGRGGYYDIRPKWFKILFGWYHLWAIDYFREKADYVVVLSNIMRDYVKNRMCIPIDKIILIPGGGICDKIKFIKHKINNKINLGYIGIDNGEERNGIVPLLTCIRDYFPGNFNVLLFGHKLDPEFIKNNKFSEIINEFGWVDVINSQDIINQTDIFILIRDNLNIATMGWPNKLGDYLSYGRPVLIDPYGDLIEFVDIHKTGFITIKHNDPNSIINELNKIIHNKYNLIEMCEYNRKIAETEISWEQRIKPIINLANSL